MKTPTEIVNDTRAFLTSTAATVAGVAASVVTLAAGVVIFVPDQYSDIKAGIVAAGAIAGVVGGAARQLYAWLDPKNTSFGRVEIPVVIDPDLSDEVPESIMDPKVDESLLPDESMPQDGE